MKPCFGYVRVSTLKQGDGASLEAQKDAIEGFASQNGLDVIRWFEEQETASREGRPIFDEMLRLIGRGEAEGLIIHRIDRSSRNYTDWAELHKLAKTGVSLYFAADALDFGTRGGQLLADIQMALAADYSRNLSLEVKKGLYARAKAGLYPFRAPIGYLDTGGGNPKALDPIKAPLVKEAFRLYLTGEYSITSLTGEMSQRGLTGYSGQPVVRRNIETILKNPFYCGNMVVSGKLYDGCHTALITAGEFQRVQKLKSQKYGKKVTKHGFVFRGLLHCGACKGLLSGERQKGHAYYRCHTKACPEGTVREECLERQVLELLRSVEFNRAQRQSIEERLNQRLNRKNARDLEKSLNLRISDLRAKQDRLTDLLVDGTIDKDAYELRRKNQAFDLQRLRDQLGALREGEGGIEDQKALIEFASDLVAIYKTGDVAQRRRLLRNSLNGLTVQDRHLRGNPADWIAKLESGAAEMSLKDSDVHSLINEVSESTS